MRSKMSVVIIAVGLVLSSCSETVGTGALHASDLSDAEIAHGHFGAESTSVEAVLGVTESGCVTVTIDGKVMMPFWPDGTEVEDGRPAAGDYTVDVPGIDPMRVSVSRGDRFRALAVIDDGPPFSAAGEGASSGKVAGHHSYCGVDASVLFVDPTSFAPADS